MGSSPNALYQYARFVLDRINTVFTRIRHNRSAILSLATSCLIIASAHGYAAGVNSNVPVSADSHGAPLSVSLQSIIPSDTSSLTEQSAWHEKSRDLTPQPRPDFIEAWGGEIVDIALPTHRPFYRNQLRALQRWCGVKQTKSCCLK